MTMDCSETIRSASVRKSQLLDRVGKGVYTPASELFTGDISPDVVERLAGDVVRLDRGDNERNNVGGPLCARVLTQDSECSFPPHAPAVLPSVEHRVKCVAGADNGNLKRDLR